VEWLLIPVGIVIAVGAAWIVFGAMGFRRNMRGK
jgi:hypothetical protein